MTENKGSSSPDRVANIQGLMGLFRIFIPGLLLVLFISWFGGVYFHDVKPDEIAKGLRESRWIFKLFPFEMLSFVSGAFSGPSLRYLLAPIAALICIFLAAGFYVKDVYALSQLRLGIRYVFSSMTALFYRRLVIDGGEKKIKKGETNLLEAIGGPGYVIIQPGNAVLFRKLIQPSNIILSGSYFMEPFETVGQVVSLDDMQDDRDGVTAMTRDGIRVTVKDIHFRYRIFPEIKNGRPVRRSLSAPYPYAERAMWNMAYNLAVEDRGLESWRQAVGRAVTGGITDFISSKSIDYLTAPRTLDSDPRREIRFNLFNGGVRIGLRNLGGELLWVDIGHFAIDEDLVDDQRTEYWAADWIGNANVIRAYGDAKRVIYQDMGRAEAQAELVMGITDALRETDLGTNPALNLRKALLTKTAEILDAMTEESARRLGGSQP